MHCRIQTQRHAKPLLTLYYGTGFMLGAAMALTIGGVAKATGVGIQTLRYYERRGLLSQPERTRAGYRQFPEEEVRRVQFIRRAQGLGFTLEEIRELLSLRVLPGRRCDQVERAARRTRERVQVRLTEMQGIEKALSQLVRACAKGSATDDCPILRALEFGGGS